MEWNRGPYYSFAIKSIFQYFAVLSVSFHDIHSLFGFFTFVVIASQLVSGTMLAFSLVPEPMLVPTVREEEDTEDLYIDDFFWLHERGVDLVFAFCYIHLFRKMYLNIFEYENESAWKSGVFTFILFQLVVFLGLVLCCTHLSEITLTISANIMHTFFAFKGKIYWWIFTDKQLNTDTMLRLAYLHYLSAFYLAYLGLVHGVDMHYDWKNETTFDGLDTEMVWWDEALANEVSHLLDVLVLIGIMWWFFFTEPEALSYEMFMWGDIGLMTDIRFYGVAPHWYFRPYMAWIIACPHHKTGIFGLIWYFFALFYQPVLHGTTEMNNYNKRPVLFFRKKFNRNNFFVAAYSNLEMNLYHQMTYGLYIGCSLYCSSFLPYGRFYNRLGGNIGLLGSFMYLFVYLGFPALRRPVFLELLSYFLYLRVNFLKNLSVVKI
jgi:quinol-cytochrome oxidoreductase complex cytochrome b subunit